VEGGGPVAVLTRSGGKFAIQVAWILALSTATASASASACAIQRVRPLGAAANGGHEL